MEFSLNLKADVIFNDLKFASKVFHGRYSCVATIEFTATGAEKSDISAILNHLENKVKIIDIFSNNIINTAVADIENRFDNNFVSIVKDTHSSAVAKPTTNNVLIDYLVFNYSCYVRNKKGFITFKSNVLYYSPNNKNVIIYKTDLVKNFR